MLTNPFLTSGYAGPEYFCDREEETSKLLEALTNGRNVALISPRRLGKTGLIQHVFHKLRELDERNRCFYIDIYNTQNQTEFVQLMARCILGSIDSISEKVMSNIATFFKSCRPVISIDPVSNSPSVSLDVKPQYSQRSLVEIISYLQESKYECYVAIDEFQQITEYSEKGTEALLRSVAQFAPNVHFIYAGSKQHIMAEMFSSPKRPFYQSTQRMGLAPLNEDVYYQFADKLMSANGRYLPQELFHDIYTMVRGFTYFVQDILNRLYSLNEKTLTMDHFLKIRNDLVNEGEIVYKDYCDLLPKGQLKLLRAIAREDYVEKPFEAQFISRNNLTAVSSVKLALNTMIKNGIIAKGEKGYYIYDQYLAIWLKQ